MEEYEYAHPVETFYYLEFMVLDFRVKYWVFEQQHDFLNLESLIQNASAWQFDLYDKPSLNHDDPNVI